MYCVIIVHLLCVHEITLSFYSTAVCKVERIQSHAVIVAMYVVGRKYARTIRSVGINIQFNFANQPNAFIPNRMVKEERNF